MSVINDNLLLRLLDIQEFFTHQWLMMYPNDHQKLAELVNIRKKQVSLRDVMDKQLAEEGEGGGGGGGTIKGFRAKDDPARRRKTGSSIKKTTRK
jgi:hypothetical protein